MKIRRIEQVEPCGAHTLRLVFNNGVVKRVNVLPLLNGPIFESLLDPEYFARVLLDPVAGTVVWPNGADLAPEALYDLPTEENLPRLRRSPNKRLQRTGRKEARR